jgi:hypothetical protein
MGGLANHIIFRYLSGAAGTRLSRYDRILWAAPNKPGIHMSMNIQSDTKRIP